MAEDGCTSLQIELLDLAQQITLMERNILFTLWRLHGIPGPLEIQYLVPLLHLHADETQA